MTQPSTSAPWQLSLALAASVVGVAVVARAHREGVFEGLGVSVRPVSTLVGGEATAPWSSVAELSGAMEPAVGLESSEEVPAIDFTAEVWAERRINPIFGGCPTCGMG